jgi:hypothetical protein
VAAGALAGLALLMVPRTPDVAKTSPTIEIEQVAQALDDMELLTSLDR